MHDAYTARVARSRDLHGTRVPPDLGSAGAGLRGSSRPPKGLASLAGGVDRATLETGRSRFVCQEGGRPASPDLEARGRPPFWLPGAHSGLAIRAVCGEEVCSEVTTKRRCVNRRCVYLYTYGPALPDVRHWRHATASPKFRWSLYRQFT